MGRVFARLKMAALVEDVVRGQQLFGVFEQHLTAPNDAQGVAQFFARRGAAHRQADDPVQRRRLARSLQQRFKSAFNPRHKPTVVEQVAGVIRSERQFGKHHDVGLRGGGLTGGLNHLGRVADQVAYREVQLRDGDVDVDAGHGEFPFQAVVAAVAAVGRLNTWRK